MATSDSCPVEREENEVHLGHRLHPGPGDRDHLAREVEAVVPHRDGPERPLSHLADPALHG